MDLTDFQFMPLYIGRLQKSKAWLRCKRQPELAFYMLNLWLRSWHEIPAGTIENDDDVLADAAMCTPDKWDRIKAKVLAGWETTEDGRLQHPVVAEIAVKSWADKQEYRRKKEEERLRKAAKRAQSSNGNDPDDPDVSGGQPADIQQTGDGIPAEIALKGKGKGEVRDSVSNTSKTRGQVLDGDEKSRRFDLVRSAMNIHPDDTSWSGIKPWLEMWEVRAADFDADVLATILSVMSKKPANFTPMAMNYFDAAVQQNFDARVRRAELPAPESTLPTAPVNQEESRWNARLAGYRKGNPWDADRNGPPPGEPGCKVPPHLLIEAANTSSAA